jgi:hypothetical protein
MEIVSPNTVKLQANESIFELIKLIKEGNRIKFLEGPIWRIKERSYDGKLATITYHLIGHHIYVVRKNHNAREETTYLCVSGRGNINEITYERARNVIRKRRGYVQDSELKLEPSTDAPIRNGGDW